MHNWFQGSVTYEKTAEEGKIVKAVESYLVDALSFTEAEKRLIDEMKPFISGEFKVSGIRRAKINEMFFNEKGDKWYRAKVVFVSLDEEKGVEKLTAVTMYAQADTFKGAVEEIEKGMSGSMADYRIKSLTETNIEDVFKYVPPVEDEATEG